MLELKQISIGYGKQDVLRDLSATFKQGCLTSVIGVNGCGKTTLLKAITGLLPLSGGEILLDGQPLSHPSFTSRADSRRISSITRRLSLLSPPA